MNMLPIVFQAVVCILCGDTNLDQNAADAVCQIEKGEQDFNSSWHAVAGPNGLSGDVLWVKGAETESFDITIGRSYPADRGMRNDSHDAFGIRMSMPLRRLRHESQERAKKTEHESQRGDSGVRLLGVPLDVSVALPAQRGDTGVPQPSVSGCV